MKASLGVLIGAMVLTQIGVKSSESKPQSLIAVTLPPVATVEVQVGPDYLLAYPDGGKAGYVANHRLNDGGTIMMLTQPKCARRGINSILCRRKNPDAGVDLVGLDVPLLNRFNVNDARPALHDCEQVACTVWFGEDANADEKTLLLSDLGDPIK